MTANANTAAGVMTRRQAQQTPPKGDDRGAGTRLRDQTERVASAPTGGEGATGVGGGAAAQPHVGGHDSTALLDARRSKRSGEGSQTGERSEPICLLSA